MRRPTGEQSIGKEVEDVPQRRSVCLIQFGVMALHAADGRELLVLHVKNFRESAARGSNLVGFVPIVSTA